MLDGAAFAADPDPVLLVHGYRGSPGTWAEMIGRFEAEGRTAVAIDLPTEDNVANAAEHGSGDSIVHFRRSDVIAAGD